MSIWLFGFGVVAATIVASLAGLLLVRHRVPVSRLQEHHDVAGFILAIVGVIYAVLLAFMVVLVWEEFEAAQNTVAHESARLVDIGHLARGFPEPARHLLRRQAQAYARTVIDAEWPAMARGEESPAAARALDQLWRIYYSAPRPSPDDASYGEMLKSLEDVSDDRRLRVLWAGQGLPRSLWIVLIFGGIVTVAFTYFFGAKSLRAQGLMTASLAVQIALALFLIGALDYPFTGDLRVTPDAFERAAARIRTIEADDRASDGVAAGAPVPRSAAPDGAR